VDIYIYAKFHHYSSRAICLHIGQVAYNVGTRLLVSCQFLHSQHPSQATSYNYKLQATSDRILATGYKLQATSYNLQATGYSYKLQDTGYNYKLRATSYKLQSTSYRLQLQATGYRLQATSYNLQATGYSYKLQDTGYNYKLRATSYKLQATRSLTVFYAQDVIRRGSHTRMVVRECCKGDDAGQ